MNTIEIKNMIINRIRNGMTREKAVEGLISLSTLYKWLNLDQEFIAKLLMAETEASEIIKDKIIKNLDTGLTLDKALESVASTRTFTKLKKQDDSFSKKVNTILGKRQKDTIIEGLAQGAERREAVKGIVSLATLYNWMNSDQEFRTRVETAERKAADDKQQKIIDSIQKIGRDITGVGKGGYSVREKITLVEIEKLYNFAKLKHGYMYGINEFGDKILGINKKTVYDLRRGRNNHAMLQFDERRKHEKEIRRFNKSIKEGKYDRFFTKEEILNFCERLNIDIDYFLIYFVRITNTAWVIEEYKKAIENNPKGIYIGRKIPLSKEWVEENSESLMKCAKSVALSVVGRYGLDEYQGFALEFMVTQLGGLEKTFTYETNTNKLEDYLIGITRKNVEAKYINDRNIIHLEDLKGEKFRDRDSNYNEFISDKSVNIQEQVEEKNDKLGFINDMEASEEIKVILQVMYNYIKTGVFNREELIELIANQATQKENVMGLNVTQVEALIQEAGNLMIEQGIVKVGKQRNNTSGERRKWK